MEGVKRDEIFKNLRVANDANTITRRMAVINGNPNVLVKQRQPAPLIGALNVNMPRFNSNNAYSSQALLNADPMKPPTLR